MSFKFIKIKTMYDVRWKSNLIFNVIILILSVNNVSVVVAQNQIGTSESPDSQDSTRTTNSEFESREIDFPADGDVKTSEKYSNIQKLTKRKFDVSEKNLEVNSFRPSQEPGSDLEWLLNIYNPHFWNPERLPGYWNISNNCQQDMHVYLAALRNGSAWAAKMSDSSGRYSSQFFFGNDFWLGSHTLCEELQNKMTNTIVPPFEAKFFVAKLFIQLHPIFTPNPRFISLGMCLPKVCQQNDIKKLLEANTPSQPHRVLQVLKVRPVPGEYRIWRDRKVHLLATVILIILVLMVFGSLYETLLTRRQAKIDARQRHAVKSNNNEDIHDLKIRSHLNNHMSPVMDDKEQLKISDSDISGEDESITVSRLGQVVLAFSALSNGRKILHCGAPPPDSLTCVHGLRFLSLAWVIMVHTYLQVFTIAENKMLRTLTERNFMFQTVSQATFSVDTFFFISGLLVTYLYFKTVKKQVVQDATMGNPKHREHQVSGFQVGLFKFFKLLGYRFIRLTPAYLFVLLMAGINMRWLRNMSVFEPLSQDQYNCDVYWWRNVFYINSLFPMKDMCMLWSWYMSNDTQFYALAIIILLISVKYFRLAAGSVIFLLISSWATTIMISLHYGYRARIQDPFAFFDELYDKPWTRLGPYLVGMFAGWYLLKSKNKIKLSMSTTVIGWFLSLATLFCLVYGLHLTTLEAWGSALYVSVGHTAWGAALAWIVIACCTGHGGCINSALSFRMLQPLSRLTYCAYLVHPVIMVLTSFQLDGPLHIHNALTLILYFGNVVASFLLSFCISLTLEAPIVRLLKITMAPKARRTLKEINE